MDGEDIYNRDGVSIRFFDGQSFGSSPFYGLYLENASGLPMWLEDFRSRAKVTLVAERLVHILKGEANESVSA